MAPARPVPPPQPPDPSWLADVRAVVAVASGKGGVGKSTVAVNLAAALAADGARAGLLDADIYGPSVPLMMGLGDQKPQAGADGRMIPLTAHGVAVMSIGLLLPAAGPVVWRGAMVHKALVQMIGSVAWGALDVLVVDMPPGTGDAHLTLTQKARPAGAVITTTAQEAALADARRAAGMFARVGVPVLGVVETMSGPVFGDGGALAWARTAGLPPLGAVPMDAAVCRAGDAGVPIVLSAPDSAPGRAFTAIARGVMEGLCVH
jgi:ATP-binding protein involved in chromosome partitioning